MWGISLFFSTNGAETAGTDTKKLEAELDVTLFCIFQSSVNVLYFHNKCMI